MRKLAFPILGVVLILGVIFGIPRIIKINTIYCESQFGPCSEELTKKINELTKSSYIETVTKLSGFLTDQNDVEKFSLRFLLPDKLKVSVVSKKPRYGLRSDGGQETALIDDSGYVLTYTDKTLLPVLKLPENPPAVGEFADHKIVFASKILGYLNSFLNVHEGELSELDFTVRLQGGQKVIFPTTGDDKTLVGAVILISHQLNSGGDESRIKEASYSACGEGCEIDLRYKNPVVKI